MLCNFVLRMPIKYPDPELFLKDYHCLAEVCALQVLFQLNKWLSKRYTVKLGHCYLSALPHHSTLDHKPCYCPSAFKCSSRRLLIS